MSDDLTTYPNSQALQEQDCISYSHCERGLRHAGQVSSFSLDIPLRARRLPAGGHAFAGRGGEERPALLSPPLRYPKGEPGRHFKRLVAELRSGRETLTLTLRPNQPAPALIHITTVNTTTAPHRAAANVPSPHFTPSTTRPETGRISGEG